MDETRFAFQVRAPIFFSPFFGKVDQRKNSDSSKGENERMYVIKHSTNGSYLAASGVWTPSISSALQFPNRLSWVLHLDREAHYSKDPSQLQLVPLHDAMDGAPDSEPLASNDLAQRHLGYA
jgi:hypothetical protein